MIKVCEICGKEFKTYYAAQRFCCRKCGGVFHSKPSTLTKKVCVNCGKEFKSRKSDAKYCSTQCWHESAKTLGLQYSGHSKNREWTQGGLIFFSALAKDDFYFPKPRNNNSKCLEDWQREADELHMDYGNYRAQVEIFGKSFEELKSREV